MVARHKARRNSRSSGRYTPPQHRLWELLDPEHFCPWCALVDYVESIPHQYCGTGHTDSHESDPETRNGAPLARSAVQNLARTTKPNGENQ